MNVIIHYRVKHEMEDVPVVDALNGLGAFLQPSSKSNMANFRYIALEMMSRFSQVPNITATLRKHQQNVKSALVESDISIRKRALDVLYQMCDQNNVQNVVKTMMDHLQTESYEFRGELVLRIAILAERYGPTFRYYIDVILKVISLAGDFVSDDIWYRAVQIITNKEALQDYAATTCYKYLSAPVHENGVKVAAYVLGEFSHEISDESITGTMVFNLLRSKFRTSTLATRAIILSAAVKMANAYPELVPHVEKLFDQHRVSVNTEVQQRANEYSALQKLNNQELMDGVFEVMPHFPTRNNPLLKRLKKQKKKQEDEEEKGEDASATPAAAEEEEEEEEDEESEEESEEEESEEEEEEEEEKQPEQAPEAQILDIAALEEALGGSLNPAVNEEEEKEAPGPEEDIFGDNPWSDPFGDGPVEPTMPEATAEPVAEFPEQDPELVQKSLTGDKGLLYSCPHLEIGFQADLSTATQVTFTLYLGNKLAIPLENTLISTPDDDAFKVDIQPAGNQIDAGKQATRTMVWHCLKPFNSTPSIQFNFTHGGRHESIDLALPLLLSSFMKGVAMDNAKFVGGWTKVGNECGPALRNIPAPVPLADFQKALETGLHMAVISNVDQVPDNLYAAGTFCAAPRTVGGKPITIPCLIRVETKPNMNLFRCTVRTGHRLVSEALLQSMTSVMNASERR